MKIAAAYIRVSTDDQTELSPDSQLKQIRDYAKAHDYILADEYIYRDDGISGRNAKNRPAFTQMIATAKRKPKPFDTILVWKFSRFARNREDSIVFKSMLKKQGINVISISEPIGDDKTAVLMEAMLEAMDEYYSLNLAEEVVRGMKEKMSRGYCVGSAPLGYYFDNGQLKINDDQAEIVRRIYRDYLDGVPMLQIAKRLNNDGYRTLKGKIFENRTIEYILRNPVYCGKLRYTTGRGSGNHYHRNDLEVTIVQGMHEPIIDPDIWKLASDKINEAKERYHRYTRQSVKHEYMLHGLVKCSECGASLTYTASKCPALQCIKYTHGKCKTSHSISLAKINAAVIESLTTANFNGNVLISPRNPSKGVTPDDTERRIRREYDKLERIKVAYAAGVDNLEEYKAQKLKIMSEIQRLESLTPEVKKIDPAKVLDKRRTEFMALFKDPNTSPQALNVALKQFIDKIVYDKPNETVIIYYAP